MDDNNQTDKIDDIMLPGFRFHPTDEELVGFYLKRKIQQRPLPIELIKQVDIYKYNPWDLPNLASTGEKESYFYCPRDRKYRNSARPNRVTGAGFWKATGTDRPIYSSEGSKCIGLKKSLVFYRGRAAKGLKTDWMMHEFRLPSISDAVTGKKILDKNFSPHDSWAICRIFKKASTMAQRAISHSWGSSLPENTASALLTQASHATQLTSENMSCRTEAGALVQLYNELQQHSTSGFSAHDIPIIYRPMDPTIHRPFLVDGSDGDFHNGLVFSSPNFSEPITKPAVDIGSMLLNPSPLLIKNAKTTDFKNSQQDFDKTSMGSPEETKGSICAEGVEAGSSTNCNSTNSNNEWGHVKSIGFPFSLPSCLPDEWKLNLEWDSPPCPSEVSPTYSNNNSYAHLN